MLRELTDGLAGRTGGFVFRSKDGTRTGPKGPFRAVENIAMRRGGGWRADCLLDLARDGIEYETLGGLAAGLRELAGAHARREARVVRLKNRVEVPNSSGWADVMVNVGLRTAAGDEHIAEIQ